MKFDVLVCSPGAPLSLSLSQVPPPKLLTAFDGCAAVENN